MKLSALLASTALLLGTQHAHATSNSIADNFVQTGPSESLVSLFTTPSTSTVNSYSGDIEVVVSGIGQSDGSAYNDAFYNVPSGDLENQYYLLNVGWNGFGLAPFSGTPHNIDNFITFINGVGAVSAPAAPAYNSVDHTYDFVINVPSTAGHLQFGVSDGDFGDNSGQYNISVFSVQAVPEPETVALMGMGFIGLMLARRRNK